MSGSRPIPISGRPKRALSAAIVRSAATARPQPPASAWPETRAITGAGARCIASMTRATPPKWARLSTPPRALRTSARSAPAQKARSPAPRSTIARTAGSLPAARKAASSSSTVARSSALRFSSRSMQIVCTPPSEVSTRTLRTLGVRRGDLEQLGEQRRVSARRGPRRACPLRTPGPGLDRAVALRLDLRLDLELEAGIVGVVVAGAADLEDHAGVALVAEREDRADARRALLHVVAARSVAGLAADPREVRVRRDGAVARETAGAPEAGRVAAQAARVRGLPGAGEALRGVGVSVRDPALELGGVAAPAGVGADVGGPRGQQRGARAALLRAQLLLLLGRELRHLRVRGVRDARQEGRVLESERVLRVVAAEAGGGVVALLHELRRLVRASAPVAGLAAHVLELRGLGAAAEAARAAPADHVAADALGVRVRAVADQRVEGAGVRGEAPGLVLELVADAADGVAAVAVGAQQHRHRHPGEPRQPHAQQRVVPGRNPAARARADAALRVDQEDVRDSAEDRVVLAQAAGVVEDDREEVEALGA